jgi:hypothetical protein
MRATVAGGRAINDGERFDEVIKNYVLDGLDDDTRKRIINEAGGLNVLKRLNKTGLKMSDKDAVAKAKEEIRNEKGGA